jgi:hypothetical protein
MLFEELKNKYPNAQLSLYGDCLIIPMSEYTKEKEKQLQAEGHISRITDYQFNEVWAVSLKKTEPYKKEPFPEPPNLESEKTKNMRLAAQSPDWAPEEEQHLLKRWEELGNLSNEKKGKQLNPEFPKRSAAALIQKYRKLKAKQEKEQAKKEPKPEPTPDKPTDEKALTYEEQVQLQLSEFRGRIVKLESFMANFTDKYSNPVEALEHTEDMVIDLKYQFDKHEHSKKTGLPLVPP